MKKNSFIVLSLCVAATVISIVFRYDALFSKNIFDYEWNTSTVLRHLNGWDEEGGFAHGFVPMVSYGLSADKHINNHSSVETDRPGYADDAGSYYYVSYPPFAYIAPYALFWYTGIDPNVIGIRLFNIAVQIATASMLFILLYRMTRNLYTGLLGYVLYLFTAISFYVHSVNYMSDMFVQFFVVLAAYLFYEIISKSEEKTRTGFIPEYIPLAGTLVLMVYTEWIGLFVCAFLCAYGLLFRKRYFSRAFICMGTFIPVGVLLLLTVQYASVADLPTFIYTMVDRYVYGYVPSGAEEGFWSQLKAIYKNYGKWFAPVFGALFTLVCLAGVGALTSKARRSLFPKRTTIAVLLFLLVPVVIHHIVFFGWTAFEVHYYSVLKTTLVFCVLVPLLARTTWHYDYGRLKLLVRIFIVLAFCLIPVGSMGIYVNEIETRTKGSSTGYCDLGRFMHAHTADDEVIFVEPVSEDRWNGVISSIIVLCAERNMKQYTTLEAASELMRKNGTTKGVIYTVDYTDSVIWLVNYRKITALPPGS